MPDEDGDDWELDDWESEAFDEGVWDPSQLDLEDFAEVVDEEPFDDSEFDVEASLDAVALDDHDELTEGGIAFAETPTRSAERGGSGMGWSAWDVGTIFALGGWLADHHAENTTRQVAAALAEHNRGRGADAAPLGAAHPPPASGYPYDRAQGTLAVADALDQGALYAELQAANITGRDLMIQAEGPAVRDCALVLIISAVPLSNGPRLWVVAEEHTGGFRASRLIPVFAPEGTVGAGIFATDYANEAVDAAVWACRREGVRPEELTVTERR